MFKVGDTVKLAKFDGPGRTGIIFRIAMNKIHVQWKENAYSHWEHELVKIDIIEANDILKDLCSK